MILQVEYLLPLISVITLSIGFIIETIFFTMIISSRWSIFGALEHLEMVAYTYCSSNKNLSSICNVEFHRVGQSWINFNAVPYDFPSRICSLFNSSEATVFRRVSVTISFTLDIISVTISNADNVLSTTRDTVCAKQTRCLDVPTTDLIPFFILAAPSVTTAVFLPFLNQSSILSIEKIRLYNPQYGFGLAGERPSIRYLRSSFLTGPSSEQ